MEGWCWFKFDNLGLALGMTLKFNISVAKGFKIKVSIFLGLVHTFVEVAGEKLVGGKGGLFGFPPSWIGLRMLTIVSRGPTSLFRVSFFLKRNTGVSGNACSNYAETFVFNGCLSPSICFKCLSSFIFLICWFKRYRTVEIPQLMIYLWHHKYSCHTDMK